MDTDLLFGIINPDSPYGWLAPDGKFCGCDYLHHDRIADIVFNKSEFQLENEGYIKLYKCLHDPMPGLCIVTSPTKEQYETLIDKGYYGLIGDWKDFKNIRGPV